MSEPTGSPPPPGPATTRTIAVDYLARVEGEGALKIVVRDGEVEEVALKIFEPPRFFEAFLRGRDRDEVPDITARICGICPVAYQMSSAHALEAAAGVHVGGPLRELRRLLYCGEWIESHVLHMFMLHVPDFLGYPDALVMAEDHPQHVKRALRIKKAGNRIVQVLGGREIHPINVRVGGFYKLPSAQAMAELDRELEAAEAEAVEALRYCAGLDYPDYQRDYLFVSLRHPDEYPMNEGRLASSQGLDLSVDDYETRFKELHVARSNALHSVLDEDTTYFLGPLARLNLNFDRLPPDLQDLAAEVGAAPPLLNPFRSLLARGVEVVYALREARRILAAYDPEAAPSIEVPRQAGEGAAATEAPRGLLFHRYRVDDQGMIATADIVPPTSQNQRAIEEDLRALAPALMAMPLDAATLRAEQAVRNYDPCISCATHFLTLEVEERP